MGVRGKSRTMMNSLMFATGVVVGFSLSLLLPSSHVHEANYQWPPSSTASLRSSPPTDCICPECPSFTEGVGNEGRSAAAKSLLLPPCRPNASEAAVIGNKDSGLLTPGGLSLLAKAKFSGINFVDGRQAFQEFMGYMPAIPVNAKALVLSSPSSSFNLPTGYRAGDEVPLDSLRTCREVDVLLTGSGRCYTVISTDLLHTSYFIQRYQADDKSQSKWKMVPRITKEGTTPPIPVNRKKHEKFLLDLFNNLPSLEKDAEAILRQASKGKDDKRVMIMCMNQGDVDMLLNFLCSARDAHVDISNLVVFGADEKVAQIAKSLGILAFSHPAFGTLPTDHAKHYGDAPFLAMMWLKIVSVWVAVRLGYNVLFQDADLVWFKDPWPVFSDPTIDGYFMDDGSRSERFSPLYANSGFYFLRSNPRITHFMQTLMFSYDMIVQYASHQTIFIQALQEHISRNGLRIQLLKDNEFVGGRVLHHEKELMAKISNRQYTPYTFHMCWTQTKADKLKYIKEGRLWWLTQQCSEYPDIEKLMLGGELSYNRCCQAPWEGPG